MSNMPLINRQNILTEKRNPKSSDLDLLSTTEIVNLFSEEDKIPQQATAKSIPDIVNAIDLITDKLKNGGRLFYIGAGTSGRLGVLDASELPPTFCIPPDLVQGIIAGGDKSLKKSSESLEDSESIAKNDLKDRDFSEKDCIIGITAGGTTPYVLASLKYANKLKSLTICISCVPKSQVSVCCDIDIRLITGPEILTGSTRLKAGTATKMVLNIISTTVMIRIGKVYGNHMVDLAVNNHKLLDRALRILEEIANINRDEGIRLLDLTNGSVKLSLLIALTNLSLEKAQSLLINSGGNLRDSLKELNI